MPSKESLLLNIGFAAAALKRHARENPGCFSHDEEWHMNLIRKDLQDAAESGGCIGAYINGPERVEEAA